MDPSSSQAGPHALRLQRSRSMVPVVLVGKEPRKEQRLKSKQSSHRPHVGVGRAAAEFSCEEVSSSRSWFSIQSERLEARPSLFFVRLGVWATRIRRIPCHRLSYGLAVTRDDCEIGARPPYLRTNLQLIDCRSISDLCASRCVLFPRLDARGGEGSHLHNFRRHDGS